MSFLAKGEYGLKQGTSFSDKTYTNTFHPPSLEKLASLSSLWWYRLFSVYLCSVWRECRSHCGGDTTGGRGSALPLSSPHGMFIYWVAVYSGVLLLVLVEVFVFLNGVCAPKWTIKDNFATRIWRKKPFLYTPHSIVPAILHPPCHILLATWPLLCYIWARTFI